MTKKERKEEEKQETRGEGGEDGGGGQGGDGGEREGVQDNLANSEVLFKAGVAAVLYINIFIYLL